MNKDIEKQKVCKVGLGLGRNNINIEGNFQMGYSSKTNKQYKPVDDVCGNQMKPPSNLPTIKEEEEENE